MPELSRLHDQNNAHLIHTQTCKPTRLHTRTRIYKFNMSGFFLTRLPSIINWPLSIKFFPRFQSNVITTSSTYVLLNYKMENKNIYIKEPIFLILNKEAEILIHQQIRSISIEKRNKNLSESRTFLRLFPKLVLCMKHVVIL